MIGGSHRFKIQNCLKALLGEAKILFYILLILLYIYIDISSYLLEFFIHYLQFTTLVHVLRLSTTLFYVYALLVVPCRVSCKQSFCLHSVFPQQMHFLPLKHMQSQFFSKVWNLHCINSCLTASSRPLPCISWHITATCSGRVWNYSWDPYCATHVPAKRGHTHKNIAP